jgi:hypothetical protein
MTVIWAGTTSAIPASEKAIELGTVKFPTTSKKRSIAPALAEKPVEDDVKKHELLATESSTPTPIAAVASKPHPSPVDYLIGGGSAFSGRLRTALIVSVSGGGKDILLSNALRAFLKVHPGVRVVVADCKDDPKEYGYYAGLPNVTVHRLNVAIASDGEATRWSMAGLRTLFTCQSKRC